MRFVEWNCASAFSRDLPRLRELGCDYAVLSEVPQTGPAASLLDDDVDWLWTGDYPTKGLAIAGFSGRLVHPDEQLGGGVHTISASTESGIGILGIWTCPPPGQKYGAQAVASIDAHRESLASTPSIITGDFNLSRFGSEATIAEKLFGDLDDLGYTSVYHHFFGESFGQETRPTHYWRWQEANEFHIDYCFVHRDLLPQVRNVEVGTFDDYTAKKNGIPGLSDHVPLIVDLDI